MGFQVSFWAHGISKISNILGSYHPPDRNQGRNPSGSSCQARALATQHTGAGGLSRWTGTGALAALTHPSAPLPIPLSRQLCCAEQPHSRALSPQPWCDPYRPSLPRENGPPEFFVCANAAAPTLPPQPGGRLFSATLVIYGCLCRLSPFCYFLTILWPLLAMLGHIWPFRPLLAHFDHFG